VEAAVAPAAFQTGEHERVSRPRKSADVYAPLRIVGRAAKAAGLRRRRLGSLRLQVVQTRGPIAALVSDALARVFRRRKAGHC